MLYGHVKELESSGKMLQQTKNIITVAKLFSLPQDAYL